MVSHSQPRPKPLRSRSSRTTRSTPKKVMPNLRRSSRVSSLRKKPSSERRGDVNIDADHDVSMSSGDEEQEDGSGMSVDGSGPGPLIPPSQFAAYPAPLLLAPPNPHTFDRDLIRNATVNHRNTFVSANEADSGITAINTLLAPRDTQSADHTFVGIRTTYLLGAVSTTPTTRGIIPGDDLLHSPHEINLQIPQAEMIRPSSYAVVAGSAPELSWDGESNKENDEPVANDHGSKEWRDDSNREDTADKIMGFTGKNKEDQDNPTMSISAGIAGGRWNEENGGTSSAEDDPMPDVVIADKEQFDGESQEEDHAFLVDDASDKGWHDDSDREDSADEIMQGNDPTCKGQEAREECAREEQTKYQDDPMTNTSTGLMGDGRNEEDGQGSLVEDGTMPDTVVADQEQFDGRSEEEDHDTSTNDPSNKGWHGDSDREDSADEIMQANDPMRTPHREERDEREEEEEEEEEEERDGQDDPMSNISIGVAGDSHDRGNDPNGEVSSAEHDRMPDAIVHYQEQFHGVSEEDNKPSIDDAIDKGWHDDSDGEEGGDEIVRFTGKDDEDEDDPMTKISVDVAGGWWNEDNGEDSSAEDDPMPHAVVADQKRFDGDSEEEDHISLVDEPNGMGWHASKHKEDGEGSVRKRVSASNDYSMRTIDMNCKTQSHGMPNSNTGIDMLMDYREDIGQDSYTDDEWDTDSEEHTCLQGDSRSPRPPPSLHLNVLPMFSWLHRLRLISRL
ncbi:hypothetical protein BDN71DRAFT_1513157 [Pleurotus eryngii]|uniref:Uncharacterized protein n=1 Tax=Pleurotus eryngii TaxID=5323 RepID=A0A9P5ZJE1_PLEER|nr:hypothetical protein BDN71DRAFT_1513157 [Pleurotus eryngii]